MNDCNIDFDAVTEGLVVSFRKDRDEVAIEVCGQALGLSRKLAMMLAEMILSGLAYDGDGNVVVRGS